MASWTAALVASLSRRDIEQSVLALILLITGAFTVPIRWHLLTEASVAIGICVGAAANGNWVIAVASGAAGLILLDEWNASATAELRLVRSGRRARGTVVKVAYDRPTWPALHVHTTQCVQFNDQHGDSHRLRRTATEWTDRIPAPGEVVDVFYDPDEPGRAVAPYGPRASTTARKRR